jgi:hypothetical protein
MEQESQPHETTTYQMQPSVYKLSSSVLVVILLGYLARYFLVSLILSFPAYVWASYRGDLSFASGSFIIFMPWLYLVYALLATLAELILGKKHTQ